MFSADQIREHMPVVDTNGTHVGTVDHMEGDSRIKLTKNNSPDGKHHLIPTDWIDRIDSSVHLSKNVDDVRGEWTSPN